MSRRKHSFSQCKTPSSEIGNTPVVIHTDTPTSLVNGSTINMVTFETVKLVC